MFKKGFTLAEVLVTLGIIGVVAAITLPSLLSDTSTAQIGPKLVKGVSMLEQANETLLTENASDTLIDSGYWSSTADYTKELRKYLKGSANGSTFSAKDGISYTFTAEGQNPKNTSDPAHMQKIGSVAIDINGEVGPGSSGTDIFYFSFWNDGSLRPQGGADWDGSGNATTWVSQCARDVSPEDSDYCAGHIFENNFKVYYK